LKKKKNTYNVEDKDSVYVCNNNYNVCQVCYISTKPLRNFMC